MKFQEITAGSKLQVPKMVNSTSKINVAYSNTNFFSLYYEPRHIHN